MNYNFPENASNLDKFAIVLNSVGNNRSFLKEIIPYTLQYSKELHDYIIVGISKNTGRYTWDIGQNRPSIEWCEHLGNCLKICPSGKIYERVFYCRPGSRGKFKWHRTSLKNFQE